LTESRLMTKIGHIPLRRCLGCRKRRRKDELIRLVYTEGKGVAVDVGQGMTGRGAYLCNDHRCLRRGLDVKVMSSAFKKRVVIDGNVRKSIESISRGD
jgi:predicted RNA-binding protein YlxR (DUF448 family)